MMMDSNLQVMMERRLMKIQEKIVNIKIKRRRIILTSLTMLMLLAQIRLMLLVLTSIELLFDPNMHALEDISIFDYSRGDEDDDAETDMNNLDTTIQVSPNLTTRIHKDHPLDQAIGDLQSATQTRRMSKNLEEHGFVSTI
ncbi:hypothetical protein Tco_1117942, partial [Tanacetum coccineum]